MSRNEHAPNLALVMRNTFQSRDAVHIAVIPAKAGEVSTLKTKSFDRWLATVFFSDAKGVERNVAVEMVSSGHAKLFVEE